MGVRLGSKGPFVHALWIFWHGPDSRNLSSRPEEQQLLKVQCQLLLGK